MDRGVGILMERGIGKSVVELRFSNGRLLLMNGKQAPLYREKATELPLDGPRFLPPPSILCLDAVIGFGSMHEKAGSGLRILRQPMDEVLFVFLLSSVKSIPQIKEMKELVARKYGEPLELDTGSFLRGNGLRKFRKKNCVD